MKDFARRAAVVAVLFVVALLCDTSGARAQRLRSGARALITEFRLDNPTGDFYGGPLYVTVNGQERKIAEQAIRAWMIEGGRRVVYSGRDGAGGYENEGQSLRIYDARTGRQRKVMSEYVEIDKLTAVVTSARKTALLVEMLDGGLGASYLAVVDPERGEVFFRRWARLLARRGDIISIGHYREDDWDKLNEDANARVKPYKREQQNLNAILKGRVIYNKPDRP